MNWTVYWYEYSYDENGCEIADNDESYFCRYDSFKEAQQHFISLMNDDIVWRVWVMVEPQNDIICAYSNMWGDPIFCRQW